MKNLMTSLTVLLFVFVHNVNAQTPKQSSDSKLKGLAITVEVDSAEGLEKTFKMEDIQKFLAMGAKDQDITLVIKCLKEPNENDLRSSVSYKITGNTDHPDEFVKLAGHIKQSVLKIYNKS